MLVWAHVGERIEKIRKGRNLSRKQFGKIIGVSGQYIGMIEKGQSRLSVNLIVKMYQTIGVSSDYILFGVQNPVLDPDTVAILNGLSQEQIQITLDIVKKVAQFINTDNGNEALIQEVASQLHINVVDSTL